MSGQAVREELVVLFEFDYYVQVQYGQAYGWNENDRDVENKHVDHVAHGHAERTLSRIGRILDHGKKRHGYCYAEYPYEYERYDCLLLIEQLSNLQQKTFTFKI